MINNNVVNQKMAMPPRQSQASTPSNTATTTLNDEEKPTSSPSSTLWDALFRCDWNRARQLLQDFPHEASYVNYTKQRRGSSSSSKTSSSYMPSFSSGRTTRGNGNISGSSCLHVACQNCAPHDVIIKLIQAFPAARTQQDEQRWTPLHVHLLYGGGRRHDSDTQEEITATILALITPGAARVHANLVGSPLHLVCRHMSSNSSTTTTSSSSSSLTILKALLKADPRQIWIPSESGYLPTCLLWRGLMSSSRSSVTGGGDNVVHNQVLDMLYLFLKANRGSSKRKKNSDDNEPEEHCLHQVLRFQHRLRAFGDFDSDFVRLYLQAFPSSTSAWCQQEGQLPLHVAAQLPVLSLLDQQRSNNSCMALSSFRSTSTNLTTTALSEPAVTNKMDDPLTILLEHEDSSTAAAAPDQITGRLPLHSALAVGRRTWYDVHGNETTGLQQLVQAYPEALLQVDPVTGLVPALLAAAAAEAPPANVQSSWSHSPFSRPPVTVAANDATSTAQLETIWELLVACPHALVVHQE